MKLLVIESPSLLKPLRGILQRYQRDEWHVIATGGHIRSLPSMKGHEFEDVFDVGGDFAEKWILDESKKQATERLAEAIKVVSEIYLATSPTREGEASAWHISEHFGLSNPRRALLNSITYGDVVCAIKNARWVSPLLVESQRARVAIDYLVGMEVSRRLWPIGAKGIGRLQGCVLRLVVERERQLSTPQPTPRRTTRCVYKCGNKQWSLRHDGRLVPDLKASDMEASDTSSGAARLRYRDVATLPELARKHRHVVESVRRRIVREKPPLSLTTACLIRIAAAKYSMTPRTATAAAQGLFERGLITCPRSDAPYLPQEAAETVRAYIGGLGPGLLPDEPARLGRRKAGDSDREAIHPSAMTRVLKDELPLEQELIYEIIFDRTVMSQGRVSEHKVVTVTVELVGTASCIVGQHVEPLVAGWKQLESDFKPADDGGFLPQVGDELELQHVAVEQVESGLVERFTEASLIEYMAEHKLGRASTYLGIVEALQRRGYVVVKQDGALVPTELGRRVDEVLRAEFDDLFREDFTANTETCLEAIAAGRLRRQRFLAKFYERFLEMLGDARTCGERRVATAS